MSQALHQFKPVLGINVDIANKAIQPTEAKYLLNVERSVNNDAAGEMGGNNTILTPSPANVAIPLQFEAPAGENFKITEHFSVKTSESYVYVHNSEGNHHIYRINADGTTQLVLLDPLLNFQKDPKYCMHMRVHLFFNHNSFTEQENKLNRKYLVWTDGNEWQGFLDVETSIATNGFRVPYYDTSDRKQLWQLPTRPSLKCITGEFIMPDLEDPLFNSEANAMDKKPWQFRQMFIYTDGRQTSWSPISAMYFPNLSPCPVDSAGIPRCMDLKLDAGGPHVEKIVLAYRNCPGSFTDIQNPEWFETAIYEKYEKCIDSLTAFYERNINPELNYNAEENSFTVRFCADGTCIPIAREQTNRNYIDIPKTSFALAPIDKQLALINNTKGDNPLDCDELKKISFSSVEPEHVDCQIEMATVKVGIIIHCHARSTNAMIFVYEPDSGFTDGLTKYFGGLGQRELLNTPWIDPGPYDQFFTDKSKDAGFIVYVDGSEASVAVTKQYKYDGLSYTEHIERDFNSKYHRREISRALTGHDYYFISIAEIKVIKGTKGFVRVADHRATKADEYRNTSTTVMGVFRNRQNYNGTTLIDDGNTDRLAREIYFDTCDGDVDLTNTPFIVADMSDPKGGFFSLEKSLAFKGYVKDELGRPVPGAQVVPFGAQLGSTTCYITDHNGFYFAWEYFDLTSSGTTSNASGVDIFVEGPGCEKTNGGRYTYNDNHRPALVTINDIAIAMVEDYDTKYFQLVRVLIKDTSGLPIGGVGVSMEQQKAKLTSIDGTATFVVRNNMLTYGTPMNLRIVTIQSAICYLTQGECDPCAPVINVSLPACFNQPEIEIFLDDSFPEFNAPVNSRGWHPGGKYPFALKLIDAAGRETFWEECGMLQLPSIQEKQLFTFSLIKWTITGIMQWPSEYVKMAIGIGKNRNQEDFVDWIVDEVKFVDSGGNPASSESADKILLSIKSLYDAASLSAFGSNARYQFQPGDRVEFLANGDGKIFPPPTSSLIFNIDSDFNNREAVLENEDDRFSYIVIQYSKSLSTLVAGAQIKFIKPIICQDDQIFYETCPLIDLINGVPAITEGFVNGFDTYFVRRGIVYNDQTNQFSFPFLHHSPSDFWGDHCIERGRVGATNKYSKRLQYGREFLYSLAFLENGNYNGLNDFSSSRRKLFTGEQRGDIIACISREQIFMMICEHDNLLANSADGFVRIDARSGQATAENPDNVISDAQSKIVGNYGCQYEDITSVIAGDGWVFWIDKYFKMPIIHNWSDAKNAAENKMTSYFIPKLQTISQFNAFQLPENFYRIVTGYDPISKNILITFFRPAIDAPNTIERYVHSNHAFNVESNETIGLNLDDNTFWHFSFTPEGYGSLPSSNLGNIFIAFKNGQPYFHRMLSNSVFNTFFGVSCDQVIDQVINGLPNKEKVFLTIQQQTKVPYYADLITTSEGHQSSIPPINVRKFKGGKFDMDILRAENSPGGLYKGTVLRGTWMRVRFVRENTSAYVIGTTDPLKQQIYNELDSFISKFMLSEQTAFNTDN